jgi:YfiR/HmsC-like
MRAIAYLGILVLRLRSQTQILPSATTFLSRALLRLVATLSLLLISLPLPAQDSAPPEYRAKANYLANFPSFVEWPADALPQGKAPFLVCVFGDFPFGNFLAEITRGTTVHNRPVEIRWIRKPNPSAIGKRSNSRKHECGTLAQPGLGTLPGGRTSAGSRRRSLRRESRRTELRESCKSQNFSS